MTTTTPEAGDTGLHEPSMFAEEPSGKADVPSGDNSWSLGGTPPGPAHFPTDAELKVLTEAAAAERIKREETARAEADKAMKAARRKAASSRS